MTISIMIHGARTRDTSREEARARQAAMAVLDAAGVSARVAWADYRYQWEYLDLMPDQMIGDAAIWAAACDAAAVAASEGWHDPNGCEITMWP